MSEPLVAVRDVFCVHRTADGDAAALQGATLEVARGEVVCVLGPSGAGKSTLLAVIAGRQTPAAGTVLVAGRDIGRLAPRVRAEIRHALIGVMTQSAGAVLGDDLQAAQAVALPLALRGIARRERRARADELLAATGLGHRARARCGELSGGERQRLALCAALAHRPALLLADEPTAELDAAAAEGVHAAIAELAHRHGTTVIMVSHDPATAGLAQRTVHIADGRLAQDGRGGEAALVIGRGGWVRLPDDVLAQADLGDRVQVHVDGGRVVLTRVTTLAADRARPDVAGAGLDPHTAAELPACASLAGVSVRRGRGTGRRLVVHELSWAPAPGRLSVITGPSGSGKTTVLRVLAGLAAVSAGTVTVDGVDLAGLDAEARAALRRARIGFLPQDPVAVGFLGAAENVELALRWRGWTPARSARRAAALLDSVGLRERARQRVGRLSAGEVQRVALARALAPAPGLVLVDEPTSRLDRAHARAIAELLVATAVREGQTIVCASHDPELIERADHSLDLAARPATVLVQ